MVPLLSADAYAVQQVPSFLPSEQPCRLAKSLALTHICSFLLPGRYWDVASAKKRALLNPSFMVELLKEGSILSCFQGILEGEE